MTADKVPLSTESATVEQSDAKATPPAKPKNPAAIKKAIAQAKEMSKLPDTSKADVARKMYETISDEAREFVIQAFIEGAGLTPKGAQTYFYNCKRKTKKSG